MLTTSRKHMNGARQAAKGEANLGCEDDRMKKLGGGGGLGFRV